MFFIHSEGYTEEQPRDTACCAKNQSGWRIYHREGKPVLVEREEYDPCEEPPILRERPSTPTDVPIEQEFIDLKKTPDKIVVDLVEPALTEHPTFAEELDMTHDEVLKNISEVMPDYLTKEPPQPEQFDYNAGSIDLLTLAGVLKDGTLPLAIDDYRESLLKYVTKGLPRQLKLDLHGDFVTINGVPTKINAKAVEMAVCGLSELVGQDKSVQTVSRIVRKKLQRLF